MRVNCRQIDQNNIDDSLACLPVFLAGCKQLLALVGPSYTSRLWCVMEIFVFVRMGGKESDMVVRLLSDDEKLTLNKGLAKFDAGKAKCFLNRDRQRLLAVIEASFGTFASFNQVVRRIFKEQIKRESARELEAPTAYGSASLEMSEVTLKRAD